LQEAVFSIARQKTESEGLEYHGGIFGAEYFLHRQFSAEGSVGFGYTSSETETTTVAGAVTTNFKDTTIGTQRVALSFNFYF
jgi:hypothetical protein